jgi:hypothetical protein
MNPKSCEKLTSVIQTLQLLQKRVDFAVSSFKPEDGVLAKDEALKILEPHLFRGFFKKETYEYLAKVLESKDEFKSRFVIMKTTGKSGPKALEELENSVVDSKRVELWNGSKSMLKSSEFEIVQPGKIIPTIRLQVRTLFSDEYDHTFEEILARANGLGLGFLPHEIAAGLILNEKFRPKIHETYVFMTKPVTGLSESPRFFGVERLMSGSLCLICHKAAKDSYWGRAVECVFSFGESET